MRRVLWYLSLGTVILLSAALLFLAGCGSGGPLAQPETGPDPSVSAAFFQLLPASQRSATTVGSDRCGNCHKDPYHDSWTQTRHAQVNVTCESCHGPGSVHATTPAKDNILTGADVTRPTVCGQCHGPTHEQFNNSRHASAVAAVLESAQRNPKTYVATCFRCHSAAFRMKNVDDKLAAGKTRDQVDTDIAALSVEQLQAFIPGTKESATCGTCHDPHRATTNLTSTGNQAYLRRSTFSTDTADIGPGTPPKSYSAFNHMCACCHNGRGVNAADSALDRASRPGMHDGPQYNMLVGTGGSEGTGPVVRNSSHSTTPDQCIHCHMPNKRHTFTVSLDTSCAPCHTATDAAARSQAVRSEILSTLLALRIRMERWAQTTFSNDAFWDYPALLTEEGFTPPDQALIPKEMKRARHNYYFVVRDRSFGVHNTPYTRHLLTTAHNQLDALGVSRAASRAPMSPQQMLEVLRSDLRRAQAGDTHIQ